MSGAGRAERREGRSRRTLLILALSGALLAAFFLSLGVWQVERLAWKTALIERVEERVNAAPVPAPVAAEWASVSPDTHEYRNVLLEGRFLNERETLVQAVTDLGPGFWVMTPLVRPNGETVLVNRGFVPPENRDPATRGAALPEGKVAIAGLLRLSEPGGGFLRSNNPAGERWFSRDVSAIAAARGIDRIAPYFVDAGAASNEGEWPRGGLTVIAFRNHHLVYALTWFALALMVGAATIFVFVDDRRRRGSADAEARSPAKAVR